SAGRRRGGSAPGGCGGARPDAGVVGRACRSRRLRGRARGALRLPADWPARPPGARGGTPESCGFRDHHEELRRLGATVAGLSAQPLEEQVELAERLGILYPVVSDPALALRDALRLPTFEFGGQTLYKRLTLVF